MVNKKSGMRLRFEAASSAQKLLMGFGLAGALIVIVTIGALATSPNEQASQTSQTNDSSSGSGSSEDESSEDDTAQGSNPSPGASSSGALGSTGSNLEQNGTTPDSRTSPGSTSSPSSSRSPGTSPSSSPSSSTQPVAPPTESQVEAMDAALFRATSEYYGNYFTRASLISDLESIGFSNADSRYAVYAIDVDWRTRALDHAQGYLESYSLSRVGLIAKLRADEYTLSESSSAANSVVVDWVHEAIDQVSGGGGYMARLTRTGMITLLRGEGFTSSEATSAANEFAEGFWNYEAMMMGYDISYGSDTRPDYQALIQLLIDYGFTQAQAEYGADNVW
jgi:hypothetical protein